MKAASNGFGSFPTKRLNPVAGRLLNFFESIFGNEAFPTKRLNPVAGRNRFPRPWWYG